MCWRPGRPKFLEDKLRKSRLTEIVPEPLRAEEQIPAMILDNALRVNLSRSPPVDFHGESIDNPTPWSVASPD